MKQFGTLLALFFVTGQMLFANTTRQPAVEWLTDYEQARGLSQSQSKPLVLFFTGSDWCTWCTKLEREVLDTPEFGEIAADNFIFVKLDYPMKAAQEPKIAEQNKQLQERFQVRSFPTLIVLDAEEKTIGLTGYRPGGAKTYAAHLSKIVSDHTAYHEKVKIPGQ